jgi:hypothetical protein
MWQRESEIARNDIIRANEKSAETMKTMRLIRWAVMGLSVLVAMRCSAVTQSPWEKPAAALVEQIAAILGPGQARLSIRNLSRIPNEDLPAIRKLLEQDLKAHGVVVAEDESANLIRVTLSENTRARLWVAEVVEGSVTQVALVRLAPEGEQPAQTAGGLKLRAETILTSREPVLAALETANGLVVLEPEQILFETRGPAGWHEQSRASIGQKRPLPRDPKGILMPDGGAGFEAWLAGTQCKGSFEPAPSPGQWTVSCYASDDPWPLPQFENATPVKAFFNGARNYFTGVVTPNDGADPPHFYAAGWIARAGGGAAMVIGSIDGKVLMIENGALKPIAGTRDWGSDFAVIHSGCGTGTQIIASSSGEAAADSLRAYEFPALEAIPVSAPLELLGTIMVLWPAPDGKTVLAAVRGAANQYEVDRVSALCN